jgi:alanyl-tRNA synthetase
MTSVNQIRSTYIEHFIAAGHQPLSSGPLVPTNDPTLMFTNAGMVQFKNVFTGVEKRPYSRAVTSQKCVRAGGKHNDLDNVGFTARHLTFFEMLGNFSFGDYFKEQAIDLAWSLITGELGLDKEKLLVTVYHTDDEAADLWSRIAGLPDERIIRIPTSDNFWSMGDTGPCGPCSEIFIDRGEHIFGGPPGSPDEDGDRFLEFWNLVFMQYEQEADGSRHDLPRPSIDTGMGLERTAAILQGVNTVYETDLFSSLLDAIAEETSTRRGDEGVVASQRVIADHLRSMSFLIAEGLLPGNEGRGYVLRRIMRRAMRHATMLGVNEPVIHRLVPVLAAEMGQHYPELVRGEEMISETVRLEEERFLKTLSRGLQILEDETTGMSTGDTLSGDTAFKLYDTYGFPLDLTQDALRTRGISVDQAGFDAAMTAQKEEARKNWAGSGGAADEAIWYAIADEDGHTEFLGYETETAEGEVLALVQKGARVDALKAGEEGLVVLNQTPFYGESGGQTGDAGTMHGDGVEIEVSGVSKHSGVFAHHARIVSGTLKPGVPLVLNVDHARRSSIRANHSATHLLHEALRQVLGTHVAQKGSLVAPDRLRFDFSHTKPLSDAEVAEVERLSNGIVLQDAPVETRLMAVDDAVKAGAMALFGEKYGDEVRVVTMGTAVEGAKAGETYSKELCGGTHVNRTGEIGLVIVVSEGSVASGVRRLEALTAEGARAYLQGRDRSLREAASALRVLPQEVPQRIETLIEERRTLDRQLAEARQKLAMGGGSVGGDETETLNGVTFMGRAVDGLAPKELRGMVDQAKRKIGSGVVAIIGVTEDGKAGIAVGVTDDLTSKISSVELVQAGSQALGGKGGGGRPDLAQAGGPDGSKAGAALDAIRALLSAA